MFGGSEKETVNCQPIMPGWNDTFLHQEVQHCRLQVFGKLRKELLQQQSALQQKAVRQENNSPADATRPISRTRPALSADDSVDNLVMSISDAKRLCCINLSGTQFFACAQTDQAAISKSLLTNWISPSTLGLHRKHWRRRIMRMISNPLMVA
jgi:hypothetical protein